MTNGNHIQIERIPLRPRQPKSYARLLSARNRRGDKWATSVKYSNRAVLNSAGRMPNCTAGHNQPEPQLSKEDR